MFAFLLAVYPLLAPRPVAAPEHFVISIRSVANLDLSAAGQGAQSVTFVSKLYLSISLNDSAGGRIANIVVDSNSYDVSLVTAQPSPALSASAKGAVFHLYVVNGKSVTPIVPAPMSMQAADATGGIELILAGLRVMQAGDRWTDTTMTEQSSGVTSGKVTRITVWTAKPGQNGALELDAAWTGNTVGGSGDSQMEMEMSGASQINTVGGRLAQLGHSAGTGSTTVTLGGVKVPMTIIKETTVASIP